MEQFMQQAMEWRRWVASLALAAIACGICAHVVVGPNGWINYRQKKAEYRQLQQDIQSLDGENQRLQGDIQSLKSDPKAIEKEAREQLRYARPGEVIVLLPNQNGQQTSASSPASR